MYVIVEPRSGDELDRLITALLNATGVVHQVVTAADEPSGGDGVEVIGNAAVRLRQILAVVAEHHNDDELAVVTGLLAQATLLVAEELGPGDCFSAG
jgi:hypothetical protein